MFVKNTASPDRSHGPWARTPDHGFVAIELASVITTVGVLLCVLAVASSRTRSQASLGQTMSNLKQIADAFSAYGPDNQDRVLGYSWKKGTSQTQYVDLATASDNQQAAANQAIDIIRRRADYPTMPKITAWLPQLLYWHLVVADFLDRPLPDSLFHSPEDSGLLNFVADPAKWHAGSSNDRWGVSTSYEISAGFWGGPDKGSDAINQDGNSYNLFVLSVNSLSVSRTLGEVVYPAAKALVYDRYQRHFGPRIGYFMYEEARVPVAAVDGSVLVRAGSNSNNGWKPRSPTNPSPSFLAYDGGAGVVFPSPPPLSGAASDSVKGRLRYTRGGLAGRDFDGPEVP